MSGALYASREEVKRALDQAETARNNAQIDRALGSATLNVEGLLHRKFAPTLATKYFDWPNFQYSRPWRLWLDQHDLITVTSLVSGGITIPPAAYFLEPVNDGPPFTRIEINLNSQSAFTGGVTHQRSIAITGLWGYGADTSPAGALAAAVTTTTATTVNVTDSSALGVGNSLLVDSERMNIVDKAMLTTGQTLQTPLQASAANDQVQVATGPAYSVGETIQLDTERMLVVDVVGNALTVKRAWDGSTLAAHTGSTIYAPRTLTVERGALGTTAATHLNAAPVSKHLVPGLVKDLTVAYSMNQLLQESGGYARVVGTGDHTKEFTGRGIAQLECDARQRHGRQARSRAV